MQVRRNGGYLALRDRAAATRALGLFLLAGGVVAVAMPLGLASNAGDLQPWQRLASMGVGIGVIAGASWWLARSPASRVELDLTRRSVRLVRLGLRGRRVRQLSFGDLEGVEVEQGTDAEGGMVWRPAVRLRTGAAVHLSELWSHDQAAVEECVAVVAEACRLPPPSRRPASTRARRSCPPRRRSHSSPIPSSSRPCSGGRGCWRARGRRPGTPEHRQGGHA